MSLSRHFSDRRWFNRTAATPSTRTPRHGRCRTSPWRGRGGKYSFEATPLVKDGVMYIVTGNDDVFALNAKTGEFLWERWSGVDQKITSVCCGWDNRGLAM